MENAAPETVLRPRAALRRMQGQPASDGAGVRLLRVFSPGHYAELDPFLLLDEFGSDEAADYIAGFPDHPHRGFETVTYMLDGMMEHRDSVGSHGLLGPGSVQWMTAGRGIIHSEMPRQTEGRMRGFQLWVNLPAAHKMDPPRYQDLDADRFPTATAPHGVTVKVIAGHSHGASGAVTAIQTEPLYVDLTLPADAGLDHPIPEGHTAFLYTFEGSLAITSDDEEQTVSKHQLAVLSNRSGEDGVRIRAGAEGGRCLLVAARPIGEPVSHWGPFVMNTREEIEQALADYRDGRLAG